MPVAFTPSDPLLALALRSSTVVQDLDREMLTVHGLAPGRYELRVDDKPAATFSSGDLAAGVNLSTLDTPMLRQANAVALANDGKISLDTTRSHLLRNVPSPANQQVLASVAAALQTVEAEQHRLAQPEAHRFELRPAQ